MKYSTIKIINLTPAHISPLSLSLCVFDLIHALCMDVHNHVFRLCPPDDSSVALSEVMVSFM
jgi:hypothetical protein